MDLEKPRGDSVRTARRETWLGGFIRRTARGKPVYVIEKRIHGALFKVSTRCHTEDAAVRELRKFEADPGLYVPGGANTLVLTPELVLEYKNWQLDERGNTYEWANESAGLLADWIEAIGRTDLRRLDAIAIKTMVMRWEAGRPARVTVLKGFFTWLRKEKGLLKHHQDPMPDVRIPQRKAAKETETGARDVPFDRVQAVYKHLRADVRDVLHLLVATGWHVAEVRRFAQSGEIRKDPTGKHLATLVTFHKRREHHVAGLIHQEHLDVAKRLREQGWILSPGRLAELMRFANKAAGIDIEKERPVYLGDMRHSVGTWAVEQGQDMRDIARAFNHESEKMLRRHYVRHAVPRATIKTRVLEG